jgi:hypothetical protein
MARNLGDANRRAGTVNPSRSRQPAPRRRGKPVGAYRRD